MEEPQLSKENIGTIRIQSKTKSVLLLL